MLHRRPVGWLAMHAARMIFIGIRHMRLRWSSLDRCIRASGVTSKFGPPPARKPIGPSFSLSRRPGLPLQLTTTTPTLQGACKLLCKKILSRNFGPPRPAGPPPHCVVCGVTIYATDSSTFTTPCTTFTCASNARITYLPNAFNVRAHAAQQFANQ